LEMKVEFLLREHFTVGFFKGKPALLYKNEYILLPQFAMVRCIDPFFTRQLELLGIKTFNSAFVSEISNNKAKTHQYLIQYNIAMLTTIYFDKFGTAVERTPFPYPFILKDVYGRGGNEVYKIKDEAAFSLAQYENRGQQMIAQPIAGQPGKDVRVFVLGKEIVAAVLRASDTDFKANFTKGGKATLYELSPEETKVVEKVVNAFEFGLVGIDFLFDENGQLLFNEIEDVVGSRTLSATTTINLMRRYLQFITERVSEQ
jgi:gamma-F420-2:alpha-L-glutamate ligase